MVVKNRSPIHKSRHKLMEGGYTTKKPVQSTFAEEGDALGDAADDHGRVGEGGDVELPVREGGHLVLEVRDRAEAAGAVRGRARQRQAALALPPRSVLVHAPQRVLPQVGDHLSPAASVSTTSSMCARPAVIFSNNRVPSLLQPHLCRPVCPPSSEFPNRAAILY